MTTRIAILALTFHIGCIFSADLSGRFEGEIRFSSGYSEPCLLVLQQSGSALKGSFGRDSGTQRLFSEGRAGDKESSFRAGDIHVQLKLDGKVLHGSGSRESQSQPEFTITARWTGPLLADDRVALLDYESRPRSPAILALREALASGNSDVLKEFWSDVARRGTPLVEPDPSGNDKRLLVTFLWLGTPATRSVLLVRGRFTFFQPDNHLFSHVEGTDLWFKTMLLPHDARFTYVLSENDPVGVRPRGRWSRKVQPDPLNRTQVPENPAEPNGERRSLVELSGAPPQPWYVKHPGVPQLQVTKLRFRSRILNNERDILIYTPPGYSRTESPYPALYLLDGEDPDGLVFGSQTVENLIHARRVPPLVVVRIANVSDESRNRELACNPEFADFLARELVPFIRANYNVSAAPASTAIGGYSLGGLAAAYAGLRHSETIGLVLVQSGSFWWEPTKADDAEPNWIAREFLRTETLPLRFHLEAGRFEVDLTGRGGNILETSRHFRDVLRAKGYEVHYQEFAGDHEYINWRGSFADALIALFGERYE